MTVERHPDNRVWDNPFQTCSCTGACGHSGADHTSYATPYLAVLQHWRPSWVFEWGPGLNTYMALASGAEVWSVEHNARWMPVIWSDKHHPLAIDLGAARYTAIARQVASGLATPRIQPPNLWFIDSGHRERILELIASTPSPRPAIVCLHDAQRERYHAALSRFRYVRFLNRGFAVASNSRGALEIQRQGATA